MSEYDTETWQTVREVQEIPDAVVVIARALNAAKGYSVPPDTAEIRHVHTESWAQAGVVYHALVRYGLIAATDSTPSEER